jgi:hypothetical protein
MNRAKRAAPAVLLCALVTLGSSPAAASEVTYPPGMAKVVSGTVSRSELAPGEPVTFTGRGFAPGSPVQLSAEGVPDAVVRADDSGAFVATLRPRGSVGAKALAATGQDAVGQPHIVSVTVTLVSSSSTLEQLDEESRSATLALLIGLALVVLMAGLRVLLHFRRGARSADAA